MGWEVFDADPMVLFCGGKVRSANEHGRRSLAAGDCDHPPLLSSPARPCTLVLCLRETHENCYMFSKRCTSELKPSARILKVNVPSHVGNTLIESREFASASKSCAETLMKEHAGISNST